MRTNLKINCCLGILALSVLSRAAQITYLNQFRVQDAFARVNTPNGQANQSNIVQAPNFGPFHSQFSLNAAKGSGASMIDPFHDSALESRGFRVEMRTTGWSNVEAGGSDTGVTFAHNIFSVVLRSNVNTTLLVEGSQLQIQTPGVITVNAVDIQKNLSPHTYFPSSTGTFGAVIFIEAGANYKLGTAADVSGAATATIPSVSGQCELRLFAELGTTVPTAISALTGAFTGGAHEASFNDDIHVVNMCDESESVGELQLWGTAATLAPSEIMVRWESATTGLGILEVVRVFDHNAGAFALAGVRMGTPASSAHSVSLSNPARFVGPGGSVLTRIAWLPTSDVDAADGWSNTLDFLRWTAH